MQLPVEYLLLRMGIAQQSLIAVRNEIMQVCAQMPVDGTNVVALEQILVLCETTLAGLDRTHVRLTAWKQIYPNHAGTLTSDHLSFDDTDWMTINEDDVLNLGDDTRDLDDDDSLDLNDDDLYRDPAEKQEYTQDECDGYLLPLSSAQDNLPVTDNSLSDHEFALLFGLALPAQDTTAPVEPLLLDIFGDPLPRNLPPQPHADAGSDTPHDPDPDYNVPGSL